MEKHEQINTTIGIALLFIVITSIFSLPNRLVSLILTRVEADTFIKNNILWLIVVAVIIIVLSVYIKKSNEKGFLDILQNENIRITTGVLIALQGLIILSSTLPNYIMSIKASLQISQSVMNGINGMSGKVITVDVISIVIILCQIFFGTYLARHFKKKIN